MKMLKKIHYLVIIILLFQGCSSSEEAVSAFIEHKQEYLTKLQTYPNYENENSSEFPKFKYSPTTDSNLVKIRNKYELNRVAGDGNEISKIINLMNWIHTTIKHDGSTKNPSPRNADNIIKVCRAENRAVNCRMLAIVLNEVYLSLGFKSRFVTCKPMEKSFNDCHVINAVYSNELKKWIYMDPTFAVYIKNQDGEYLSIQDVRDYLISNKKVIVNENINWNGEPYNSDEYLAYMTKNLFRLESPLESAYNYESQSNMKYMELVPKGYSTFSFKGLLIDLFASVEYSTTSNPNYFWEK